MVFYTLPSIIPFIENVEFTKVTTRILLSINESEDGILLNVVILSPVVDFLDISEIILNLRSLLVICIDLTCTLSILNS